MTLVQFLSLCATSGGNTQASCLDKSVFLSLSLVLETNWLHLCLSVHCLSVVWIFISSGPMAGPMHEKKQHHRKTGHFPQENMSARKHAHFFWKREACFFHVLFPVISSWIPPHMDSKTSLCENKQRNKNICTMPELSLYFRVKIYSVLFNTQHMWFI